MKILEKIFKNKNQEISIYNEWQLNLNYLNSLKPDHTVVTHIVLDDKKEQYLLIYKDKKVLFMSKSLDTNLHVVFADIHLSMMKHEKLWECIKSSKDLGNIIPNDSLVQFIVEKMELNAGFCGFKMEDELQFWRKFCLFTQDMNNSKIFIPEYNKEKNIWVD